MALALHQTSANASRDTGDRYAISSVHQESGTSPARRTACARMERPATRSMVNVYAPEAGPAITATRSVPRTAMDKSAARSVAAETVAVAITSLASVTAHLAIQGLFAMICAHLENMGMNASRSASVRMVAPAILRLVNAIVLQDGLVQCARIAVQMASGAGIALGFATATTKLDAITSQGGVNASLVSTMKSA